MIEIGCNSYFTNSLVVDTLSIIIKSICDNEYKNDYVEESILNDIKPDVFVKGGDYRGKEIPEMKIMEKLGGHVEYVSIVEGWSSTKIIEKLRKQNT